MNERKDERDDLNQPMQPVGLAKDGCIRFKPNKIVEFLVRDGQTRPERYRPPHA